MIIKLSYDLDETTPMYGGKQGFVKITQSSIQQGDTANTQQWNFPNHLGTHIDFPIHFHQDGQTGQDFSSDSWIVDGKKVHILEVSLPKDTLLITPEHIVPHAVNAEAECVLLKTQYHRYRNNQHYWEYNPGLSIEMVTWLTQTYPHLRMIGLDSISISSWQHRDIGRKVHKTLLDPNHPILLIEDMDLSQITKDTLLKQLVIAPLMVHNADGSPCTILAEVEE